MKIVIVALRDQKASTFTQPMFYQTTGAAIRAFQDLLNDSNSAPARHPEDYKLFHIGYYDEVTGQPEAVDGGPVLLVEGQTLTNR